MFDYIKGQQEHHRKTTFQDELIMLLKKHKIEFDERYLWMCLHCPYRAAVSFIPVPRATALRAFALGCYATGFQPV